MVQCSSMAPGKGFISSVTNYLDCQAQILGSNGWATLSSPGSSLSLLLTGLLTIFVALIGYNLLLGRGMSVRGGTIALVKIGAVLALATSWPAYRTLIYDVVTVGPFQLVQEIGPSAGVTGSDGSLLGRLDRVDQGLAQLALLGAGTPPVESSHQLPPPPFGGFDTFALGGSRILFELTAIAGLAIVRIVAGLTLALGPFFIAFFLFEGTRSLFEGWIRVLAGAALGAVGVSIALGLELALLEPWLSNALARRMAGEAVPGIATELAVLAGLWTIIIVAVLWTSARIAQAFRLPGLPNINASGAGRGSSVAGLGKATTTERVVQADRSRATKTADAIVAATRREAAASIAVNRATFGGRRSQVNRDGSRTQGFVPTGRTFQRRAKPRVSAGANRRDGNQ